MAVKKISDMDIACEKAERQPLFYTNYSEVNDIINQYIPDMKVKSIWFSVDGTGFCRNIMRDRFQSFFELLLSTVIDACEGANPPGKRYLKIRSMDLQNKLFMKIIYSKDEFAEYRFDKRLHQIYEMVQNVNGYYKMLIEDEECVIQIALAVNK